MPAVSPSKYLVMAGWSDVPHLDEQTKRELFESTPAHLREARSKGIPVLGKGRIFPVDESLIKIDPITLPDHWPRIAGMDIGWDHPTAIVWIAWDRDNDILYLYDLEMASEKTPSHFAPLIKRRGEWIPVAWPHDALQHEKGTGVQVAEQYRLLGVNMLHEMAQFPETGDDGEQRTSRTSVEAGLLEMLQRMESGRFKVFSTIEDWLSEFRIYRRDENGKVVKLIDDAISASRYAMMMRRYAICPPDPSKAMLNPRRNYDWRVG